MFDISQNVQKYSRLHSEAYKLSKEPLNFVGPASRESARGKG